MIGGNAPSVYLARLKKSAEVDDPRLDAILHSHLIKPDALRTDDFEDFFAARTQALIERIEQAMEKPMARTMLEPEPMFVLEEVEAEDEA